jgi:hypothetical protein
MIDETFRKSDGKLLPVVLPGMAPMEWKDVARVKIIENSQL